MIPQARFLSPLQESITFEDVSVDGPRGRPLVEGVSATLPCGSRTAIVGLDEAAKLAVACLVPRLLDPSRGRVRIDGVDLREVTLESLRAQVATLFQADLVFSDTVLANIGLGDPSYGLPRIIEAAKLAHAHQFIQDLPDGYETVIGPLGEPLTGDQMFRIGLARAFLHDPSIVLIEEATTPLDPEIKPLIDDSIDRLARNRTLLFLPHRLSTIRRCDQVLVLHEGRLVDAGPPRELHTRSRVFRHLKYLEFNPYAAGGEVEEFGSTHA
jgi:ABC-type multidrug transport system fused ATPase/permease subunit